MPQHGEHVAGGPQPNQSRHGGDTETDMHESLHTVQRLAAVSNPVRVVYGSSGGGGAGSVGVGGVGGVGVLGGSILSQHADRTHETEFFSPVPEGYRPGRHKYVVVFGTVMSGLGKGIFASSVAKLLKDKSLSVSPMKLEGYLNIDAGTLNPFRHGEVFVLDDGTECDMDLGTYERLLDQNLSHHNFTTSGQIFATILERERRGSYLGRDVQMIPHVTGEVKRRVRELAMLGDGHRPADVVFVEVGGTVGDYENGFYIEAMRELAFEEGENAVCFVALTYIIKPETLGEQKSKAAQLGVKRLMEAGIQPHLIACRATDPVTEQVREKIAMFTNVPMRRVFSMHDRPSVYTIPDDMRLAGLDREILSVLDLHGRVNAAHEDTNRRRWASFVERLNAPKRKRVTIGVTGKYVTTRDAYASIDKALEHCAAHLDCEFDLRWVETTDLRQERVAAALEGVDGVIVPGGFGLRGVEGKIACVRHCRESGMPYLGICLGFQCAVIEHARNVLAMADAGSSEFHNETGSAVISELPEQKQIEGLGGTMRLGGQDVLIHEDTLAHYLFADTHIRERFRHRYEVDPAYIDRLQTSGLRFSGVHPTQPIMQILERDDHPYFIAAQFHPELTSRPLSPQPLFLGLVASALRMRYPDDELSKEVVRWTAPKAFTPSNPGATTP